MYRIEGIKLLNEEGELKINLIPAVILKKMSIKDEFTIATLLNEMNENYIETTLFHIIYGIKTLINRLIENGDETVNKNKNLVY